MFPRIFSLSPSFSLLPQPSAAAAMAAAGSDSQHLANPYIWIYLFIFDFFAYVFGIFTLCQHHSRAIQDNVKIQIRICTTMTTRQTAQFVRVYFNIRFDLIWANSFLFRMQWNLVTNIALCNTFKSQMNGTLPFCFGFTCFLFPCACVYKTNVRASGTEITFDAKYYCFCLRCETFSLSLPLNFFSQNCLTHQSPDTNSNSKERCFSVHLFIYFSII